MAPPLLPRSPRQPCSACRLAGALAFSDFDYIALVLEGIRPGMAISERLAVEWSGRPRGGRVRTIHLVRSN